MVVLIQARMASRRWPGKIMQWVDGEPMLERVIHRVMAGTPGARHIVLTTPAPEDEATERVTRLCGCGCLRMQTPEPYVGRSFVAAMAEIAPDDEYVVRVCADQPLLDWKLAEPLLHEVIRDPGHDYYSYHVDGWPVIQTYLGQGWEVAKVAALERWHAAEPREHVTYDLYSRPSSDAVMLPLPPWVPLLHGTVDVPEDVARIEAGAKADPLHKQYTGRTYA